MQAITRFTPPVAGAEDDDDNDYFDDDDEEEEDCRTDRNLVPVPAKTRSSCESCFLWTAETLSRRFFFFFFPLTWCCDCSVSPR